MRSQEFKENLPALVRNYKASPDVLDRIKNIKLLMIIGPSGVGKTTLIKHLGLPYVPADTTRAMRPEEQEGVDYHFRSDYRQITDEIKNGRFIQIAVGPAGDLYATRAAAYPEKGVAAYAVVADVVPVFRQLGFGKTISAFIVPPSFEEWMRRMGSHNLTADQLSGRLDEAHRSISFALSDSQTHFILNDNIQDAVTQLRALLDDKTDKLRQNVAKQAARTSLRRLQHS